MAPWGGGSELGGGDEGCVSGGGGEGRGGEGADGGASGGEGGEGVPAEMLPGVGGILGGEWRRMEPQGGAATYPPRNAEKWERCRVAHNLLTRS